MHMRAAAAALPGMGRCRRRAQGECRGMDALALGLKGGAKQRLSRQSVRHEVGGRDGARAASHRGPGFPASAQGGPPGLPFLLEKERREGERERRAEERRREAPGFVGMVWGQSEKAGRVGKLSGQRESSRASSPGILGSLL